MRDRVLCWFGPVSIMQIKPTVPDDHELAILGCTGDGSDGKPRCQDHADAWRDASGRRLAGMRRQLKIPKDDGRPFAIAAYSAGGQCAKRLALHPEDRAAIGAMYLADATYTTAWANPGKEAGLEELTRGFVLFALDAIRDGRWLIATASANPNATYPSGAQTLAAIWRAIEGESGRTFEDASADPILAGLRAPVRAGRLANVLLVDFGAVYQHGEHAMKIAPVLLPRMLAAAKGSGEGASSSSSSPPAARATTGRAPVSRGLVAWVVIGLSTVAHWLWRRRR